MLHEAAQTVRLALWQLVAEIALRLRGGPLSWSERPSPPTPLPYRFEAFF